MNLHMRRRRMAALGLWACCFLSSSSTTTLAFHVQPTPFVSNIQRTMVLRDPPSSTTSSSSSFQTDDDSFLSADQDGGGNAGGSFNVTSSSTMDLSTEGGVTGPTLSAEEEDEHDFMVWKVNASDAFGSMLMQMQSSFQPGNDNDDDNTQQQLAKDDNVLSNDHPRQSEFLLQDNDTTDRTKSKRFQKKRKDTAKKLSLPPLSEEADGNRDAAVSSSKVNDASEPAAPSTTSTSAKEQPPIVTSLSAETAKELDDAVHVLEESYPFFTAPMEVVEVPSIYSETEENDKDDADTLEAEHGDALLSRDLRQLAVSIASRTESVEQWATVVAPQIGGIHPLLETIRVGAQRIGGVLSSSSSSEQQPVEEPEEEEEDVMEAILDDASRACRALRDLCALSPELAAVLVDSVLRANDSYDKGGLMRDLCRLLQYASRYDELTAAQNTERAPPRQWFVRGLRRKLQRQPSAAVPVDGGGESTPSKGGVAAREVTAPPPAASRKSRRIARRKCQLYVVQLLLAMSVTSDEAVHAIRDCPGMKETVLQCSSFAQKERRRRWLRYPVELSKWLWKEGTSGRLRRRRRKRQLQTTQEQLDNTESEKTVSAAGTIEDATHHHPPEHQQDHRQRRPFLEAASLANDLNGEICKTSNQVLAAVGCNQWIPKTPGQRGLRILSLDGGGSRGMSSVTAVAKLAETVGVEVCDSFDIICGTSTGGIIAFLTGLRQETGAEAVDRYNELIKQIFVKSPLSTPLMLFTTASYDESHFNAILQDILEDDIMLDSRADATTPLVFAVTSKMSSTPTHVALFKNYNYANGELADPFVVDPDQAREELGLPLELEHPDIRNGQYRKKEEAEDLGVTPGQRQTGEGSRHPGSFRVLQRYALRASTAAPTFFKPVMMGGEMYCDGGIVSSNPTAIAVHEARTLFPDVPIELVVSIGTGLFYEQKSAPRIGWDGIIGQIVNSACDGEQIHHILEDILGDSATLGRKSSLGGTKYYRFNPTIGMPDEYPIDVVDPDKLEKLKQITVDYMNQPEQQEKLQEIAEVLTGQNRWSSRL